MISCIFTLDYEIYGNGEGSLSELVYQPTEKLLEIFAGAGIPFVCFAEVAELERIEEQGTDSAIVDVRQQLTRLRHGGHEIALHLHPQWYNARHESGRWVLDDSEYNLCTLPKERIVHIVHRAIAYLREVLGCLDYTPVSFRAGNWLFQPSNPAASILASAGIRLDSSVFKGGLQRKHGMDYRRASKNGPYWNFADDVNEPASNGPLLELPIHTEMVPAWQMLTGKRLGLQTKGCTAGKQGWQRFARVRDFLRLWHPQKFDFCKMTLNELVAMTDRFIRIDRENPDRFTPIVAIGHSKDLIDFQTIESYLVYLEAKGIEVTTLEDAFRKCETAASGAVVK